MGARVAAIGLCALAGAAGAALPAPARAQFREDFRGPAGRVPAGWTLFTGDGAATMTFTQAHGLGLLRVDATRDTTNLWWALIKRNVAPYLDLRGVGQGRELRVTARVRARAAPRRVNLHLNTQRTTDFHTHLMEYDLPDTRWHVLSLTTHGFDAHPGDTVNAQLALMDWGIGRWGVDIDWYRVDVVDPATVGPDLGEPIPYRPPVPDPASFAERLEAKVRGSFTPRAGELWWVGLALVDSVGAQPIPVLRADNAALVLLAWDLAGYAGKRAARAAVLELRTVRAQRAPTPNPELALLRVAEIPGGGDRPSRGGITLEGLARGRAVDQILSGQMIQDVPVADPPGLTRVVISRPVLQRLLDGRSRGLVLRAQPALCVYFAQDAPPPRLYFDVQGP